MSWTIGIELSNGGWPEHIFVEGEPSTYLTPKENAWKNSVREKCPKTLNHPRLDFRVGAWKRCYNYFDLDNIAKPVLDCVGLAPQTVWVSVTLDECVGVYISDEPASISAPKLVAKLYIPNPPTRSVGGSAPLPALDGRRVIGTDEPLGISLSFDSATTRIGDFGFQGPVKPLLDKLGPLLGTYSQGAADYRLHEIMVTKGHRPEATGVTVRLWRLHAG